MLVSSREPQVVERDLVDGEDGTGRPVLGGHVADGGPVLERHGGDAGAEELDELAHDTVGAEELGDGEHQVGGGGTGGHLAGQPEADHRGEEHRQRLAEHGCLSLDAADSPAQHAEPVDHGRVGVGAHQGVAVCPSVLRGEHHP